MASGRRIRTYRREQESGISKENFGGVKHSEDSDEAKSDHLTQNGQRHSRRPSTLQNNSASFTSAARSQERRFISSLTLLTEEGNGETR
jgi:hypothetical protein